MSQHRLISHELETASLETKLKEIASRLKDNGDDNYFTVAQKLDYLNQLSTFDFGRYLLLNSGINGYWTHYMLTHPWLGRETRRNNRDEPLTPLESFLLDSAPTMLATQQRFKIFLMENQKQVRNGAKLACIPCGMLGELLYLDYHPIENIQLIGIDYDVETFNDARQLANSKHLTQFTTFIHKDAWEMNIENEFDLISSNGLSIYEPDDNRITDLYRQFYHALKPGGKLVTSFLTPLPNMPGSEWDMSKVNLPHMMVQKLLFVDILQAKFQCYRTTEHTKKQLSSVSFKNIQFIYDDVKIFPTVVAFK